jgi:hypothetical protein
VLAALAAICLLAAPARVDARPANPWPTVFDVGWLRPLTFLQLAAGAVLFVPAGGLSASLGYLSSPTSSATMAKNNFDEAFDIFVREPYERTFLRPLGAW